MSDQRGVDAPTFIIKSGDVYYVTAGVLEFDRTKAGDDAEMLDAVDSVEATFNASLDRDSQARRVAPSRSVTAAQTEPDFP